MRFPHARKGVRKLFLAALIQVIAAVLLFVAAVLAILSIAQADSTGMLATAGILTLVASFVPFLAFILEVLGLYQAKRDDPNFAFALWVVFLTIVIGVVKTILHFVDKNWTDTASDILNIADHAFDTLLIALILTGISTLADKLGETGYARRGRIIRNIFVLVLATVTIMDIIVTITRQNETAAVAMSYISLVASALETIASIWYFFYLGKASRKLRK